MTSTGASQAVATVWIDNAAVRVTGWRFAPGATTGHHRHELPYVIVPVTACRLAVTGPDGTTTASLVAGEPYFRPAGIAHEVRNADANDCAFVEIELKPASCG